VYARGVKHYEYDRPRGYVGPEQLLERAAMRVTRSRVGLSVATLTASWRVFGQQRC
jgi:hypothetical protein